VAIVGGSKVSTKLGVLDTLIERVDQLIAGGGIANNFIAAAGHPVGRSLYEPDLLGATRELLAKAAARGAAIPLPSDVVVAAGLEREHEAITRPVGAVGEREMILDVGPATSAAYAEILESAGTIVWNGPVGVFEDPRFAAGTRRLAEAVAASKAFSIAGGGDTLAALDAFGLSQRISYVSTGGGAFLEFLEGKTLPAVAMLEQRARS
jgi:phosphoglycerate kinase